MSRNSKLVSSAAGFTLIELLVVVVIIASLTAISISGIDALRRNAAANATRTTLQSLNGVMEQFQRELPRRKMFSDTITDITGNPRKAQVAWQTNWNTDALTTMSFGLDSAYTNSMRFIAGVRGLAGVQEQLRQLPSFQIENTGGTLDAVLDDAGSNPSDVVAEPELHAAVLDGWGQPIMLIQVPTQAGTTAPQWERDAQARFGSGQGRRYYFISAGRDRNFGSLASSASDEAKLLAVDNLTSLEGAQ